MKQPSVSPDLWETMVPQPLLLARRWALMLSVTVPIWFTLSSRQLQAFFSTAVLMRIGLVTVRSSPTIWMGVMGNSLQKSRYIWQSLSPETFWEPSLLSVLKSRSYTLSPLKNSEAATSIPISILPVYPAFEMADSISRSASLFSRMLGAKPPSSPTAVASRPNFALMTDLRWW